MKGFLITALILLSGPLVAQVEQTSVFSLSLEELMQVQVSGSTLTNRTVRDVPSSVSVFTRQDINRLGIDYLDELMNYAPGFQAYRQGEDGSHVSYSSRGRRLGSSGREVLILIDGLRTDTHWNNGTSFNLPLLSLNNIERVEFIRGPGSAIYGSNAFLAVINIITIKDANQVQLSVGENNLFQGQWFASKKWNDVELNFFAQYFQNNGDLFNVQSLFDTHRINTQDPVKGGEFYLKARKKNTTLQLMLTERQSEDFYFFGASVDNNTNKDSKQSLNIALEQYLSWSANFESRIKIGYRKVRQDADFRLSPVTIGKAAFESKEYSLSLRNNWQKNDLTSYQFGFEYRRPEMSKTDIYFNNSSTPIPLARLDHQDVFGLYGQLQANIFDNTDLILGARFDHYSSIDSNLSPRLALVHTLHPNHTLKILYGEAFRSPATNELDSINNPVVTGNPSLHPETVKTWELIWLSQWGNNTMSLGLFNNIFEQSIEQQLNNISRTFVNAESDRKSQGIESEFIAQLNQQWSLRASYTLLTDKPSASFREADSMASLLVNYHHNKWNLNLSAYYHNERDFLQQGTGAHITLKDYFVSSTKVKYQFDDELIFFMQIKNIFAENYETPSQAAITEGIPNRGREILVGTTWQY